MKKFALFGGLLALVCASAAYAAGQFPNYPPATSSPTTGNVATLPLTGNEQVPADTNLPNGVNPQTELISTSQLKAYVLTSPTVTGSIKLPLTTIAALPVCTAALQGALASVSNGTAYNVGVYGGAVGTTGALTRVVVCTNVGGATTYAWAYN